MYQVFHNTLFKITSACAIAQYTSSNCAFSILSALAFCNTRHKLINSFSRNVDRSGAPCHLTISEKCLHAKASSWDFFRCCLNICRDEISGVSLDFRSSQTFRYALISRWYSTGMFLDLHISRRTLIFFCKTSKESFGLLLGSFHLIPFSEGHPGGFLSAVQIWLELYGFWPIQILESLGTSSRKVCVSMVFVCSSLVAEPVFKLQHVHFGALGRLFLFLLLCFVWNDEEIWVALPSKALKMNEHFVE